MNPTDDLNHERPDVKARLDALADLLARIADAELSRLTPDETEALDRFFADNEARFVKVTLGRK